MLNLCALMHTSVGSEAGSATTRVRLKNTPSCRECYTSESLPGKAYFRTASDFEKIIMCRKPGPASMVLAPFSFQRPNRVQSRQFDLKRRRTAMLTWESPQHRALNVWRRRAKFPHRVNAIVHLYTLTDYPSATKPARVFRTAG